MWYTMYCEHRYHVQQKSAELVPKFNATLTINEAIDHPTNQPVNHSSKQASRQSATP